MSLIGKLWAKVTEEPFLWLMLVGLSLILALALAGCDRAEAAPEPVIVQGKVCLDCTAAGGYQHCSLSGCKRCDNTGCCREGQDRCCCIHRPDECICEPNPPPPPDDPTAGRAR